jgi:hypothetical protein
MEGDEKPSALAATFDPASDVLIVELLDRHGKPYASRRFSAEFFRHVPEDPTDEMFGLAKRPTGALDLVRIAVDIEIAPIAVVEAHREVKRRLDQSMSDRARNSGIANGRPRVIVAGPGDLPRA